jgi:hypothetical protein
MFHRICNVDVGPVDPDPFQRVIEQLSRGADEWPSRNILSVSRLFSHEHDFGIYTAFAENCLICSLPRSQAWQALAARRNAVSESLGGMSPLAAVFFADPARDSLPVRL